MAIMYKGQQYVVTTHAMEKAGLTGVSIDGKHIGNFRTEEAAYRYGMGPDALRFPLSMSEIDVAEQCALAWLHTQDEKKGR